MTANRGKPLLIVGASPASREAEEALRDAGYSTFSAPTIERAAQQIAANGEGFGVVLVDCAVIAGADRLQAVRELLKIRELPLLFLYEEGELADPAIAECSATYGFVPKASAPAALVLAVRTAARLFEERDKVSRLGGAAKIASWEYQPSSDRFELSAGASTLFGFTSRSCELSDILAAMLPEYRPSFRELLGSMAGPYGSEDLYFKIRRPDSGTLIDIHAVAELGTEGKSVLGLFQDITVRAGIERQLAHEGLFMRTILDNWPDPAYFIDLEGRKVLANKADLRNMAMYYQGRPIGKTDLEIYPGEVGKKGHEDNLSVIRSGEPIINREEEFPVPGGAPLWLLTSKIPIRDQGGAIVGLLGIGRDITRRKGLEESLLRVANEKSILMKELEHRVKNSLGVVSSLLSLELDRLADEGSRRVFTEAIDRIKAIASVYERLYLSEDLSHIDMRDYFEYLVESISRTISIDRGRVRVSSRLADLKLEAQRAVSVGLILNEMLTNAFKYAYPPPASGEIRVRLEEGGGSASFRVEDDGVGLPGPLDPDEAESMGMSLISLLARQLGGKASIETGKGLRISVVFPYHGQPDSAATSVA
jgi:PAS domain S-box-containing protein